MPSTAASLADTIVACATPPGEGAVAVVRLSGPRARTIGAVLAPSPRARSSHRLELCWVVGAMGQRLDRALVVEMHAPRSFTGEDVVELHCHGARVAVAGVLEAACQAGARLAQPGEFTLRAFLGGKLDLAQAEAVQDLVAARSDIELQHAIKQLDGGLSRQVSELLLGLEGVLAEWLALLDFPEHVGSAPISERSVSTVREYTAKLQSIVDGCRLRRSDGCRVVLCGAPNVGKSSLLNAWLGEERVLVDAEPGTTRDPVEVQLGDGGLRWAVWDTAGLRDVANGLEARGAAKALELAQRAELAVWLVSGDSPVWPPAGLQACVVGSKADLVPAGLRADLEGEAARRGHEFLRWVSAASGEGVEALRQRLETMLAGLDEAATPVRERHLAALQQARSALSELGDAIASGVTLDVLAATLEGAIAALGAILGRDIDAEVLDRIFADFCIGK